MPTHLPYTQFKPYQQLQHFADLIGQEWPDEWCDFDSIVRTLDPPAYEILCTQSEPAVDLIRKPVDNTHTRWLIVHVNSAACSLMVKKFLPQAYEYARGMDRAYERVGFLCTDSRIPPHVDSEYYDDASEVWNLTVGVRGSMLLDIGTDSVDLSGTALWNGGVEHSAEYAGFYCGAIAQVCL